MPTRSKLNASRMSATGTLLLLICVLYNGPSQAQGLSGFIEHSAVPGGISLVDLELPADAGNDGARPMVTWNDKPVAVIEQDASWFAVVGIPLGTKAGQQTLTVEASTNEPVRAVPFTVTPYAYEEQRLIIKNKRKVNPAPMDMERIGRENKRLKVVKSYRADAMIASSFDWPMAGIVSSPFGLKRFYNDQPRRPHGGIDIAAPEGEPILAPADGVVIETGDYFFNGNSVFIEHGLGLQTFYAHMSRIDVEPGQRVSQGQVIGAVGQTGRVTGPHLHWSVGLNGTWVNPLLLLPSDSPPPAPE